MKTNQCEIYLAANNNNLVCAVKIVPLIFQNIIAIIVFTVPSHVYSPVV